MMGFLSRKRLLALTVMFVLGGLLLVACERPFPRSNDQGEPSEQTGETDADVSGEPGEGDPNVGGGVGYPPPEAEDVTPESPRVEQEETAEEAGATEETDAEGEAEATTEEETTAETEEEEEDLSAEEGGDAPEDSTAEAENDQESAEQEQAAETEEETGETEAAEQKETAEEETETPTVHIVQPGENLYRIGLKYGISWVRLAQFNNIANPNRIVVGQPVKIPGPNEPQPEPTPSPSTETTYVVKAGDNLYRIGLAYGISWIQIAEANGLINPNQITPGQVLKIPVDTPGPTPQFTHQVRPGETLFKISLRYGIPWPTIAEANDLESPYVIYVGQSLVIPGG